MTAAEIVAELKKLSTPERLGILEAVLHLTREEMQQGSELSNWPSEPDLVALATPIILPKPTPSKLSEANDLSVSDTLDSEDFYDW